MGMNLRFLRVFSAVAECESFSRAAETLGITQPAVSRAVAELERELRVPLIERMARGAQLTEAGAVLHEHARVIFGAEAAAAEDLAHLRGLRRGTLRLGASTTIATYLLPELLAAFHEDHPSVELVVTSANTHDIAVLVTEHRVDVALVEGPVRDARITSNPWREDELVVIAGPSHPLAQRRRVSLRELATQLIIVREPGSGTREVVGRALRRHRVAPRRTLEVGSTEAIKRTVAAGLGVAIVSTTTITREVADGVLTVLPVQRFEVRRTFMRLSLPGRKPAPPAAAFMRYLR